MSIPRLILLITLAAIVGPALLLMVIGCAGGSTSPTPSPTPTSTPRPRIGDWSDVVLGEMTNFDGLQVRCWKGEPFIHTGPIVQSEFHGGQVPTPKEGTVTARVMGADRKKVSCSTKFR